MTAAASLVIGAATLGPQPIPEQQTFDWTCLVCGEYGGADIAANVLLFVPLGAGLALLTGSGRRATGIALLLTAAIEIAQGFWIVGRFGTLSDVVTNTLGAALGAALATHAPFLATPPPHAARWLAAVAGVAWIGTLAFSAWALDREVGGAVPRPTRGMLAAVPGSGWYTGHVRAAALDGVSLGAGPPNGPVIVGASVGRDFTLASTLDACDATGRAVVFLHLHDALGRSQAALGQDARAARFTARLRANSLRLRRPTVVLPDVFPFVRDERRAAAGDLVQGVCEGETRVRGESRGHGFVLWASGPDGTPRERRLMLSPTLGWSLIMPFIRPGHRLERVVTAGWLAALLAPFGYWTWFAARHWSPGRARGGWIASRRPFVALPVWVGGLAGVPLATGYAVAAWWEWVAAAAGLALGALLATRMRDRFSLR